MNVSFGQHSRGPTISHDSHSTVSLRDRLAQRGLVDKEFFIEVILGVEPCPSDEVVEALWSIANTQECSPEALMHPEVIRLARSDIFRWLYVS